MAPKRMSPEARTALDETFKKLQDKGLLKAPPATAAASAPAVRITKKTPGPQSKKEDEVQAPPSKKGRASNSSSTTAETKGKKKATTPAAEPPKAKKARVEEPPPADEEDEAVDEDEETTDHEGVVEEFIEPTLNMLVSWKNVDEVWAACLKTKKYGGLTYEKFLSILERMLGPQPKPGLERGKAFVEEPPASAKGPVDQAEDDDNEGEEEEHFSDDACEDAPLVEPKVAKQGQLDRSDASNKPEKSDAAHKPEKSDASHEPDMSDAANKPEKSDAAHKAEKSDASHKPDMSDAAHKQDSSDAAHKPDTHLSDAAHKPDSSDAAHKPDMSDAAHKPDHLSKACVTIPITICVQAPVYTRAGRHCSQV